MPKNEDYHKILQPLCEKLSELEKREPSLAKKFQQEGTAKELEKDKNITFSISSNQDV